MPEKKYTIFKDVTRETPELINNLLGVMEVSRMVLVLDAEKNIVPAFFVSRLINMGNDHKAGDTYFVDVKDYKIKGVTHFAYIEDIDIPGTEARVIKTEIKKAAMPPKRPSRAKKPVVPPVVPAAEQSN